MKNLSERVPIFKSLLELGNRKGIWCAALLALFAISAFGLLVDIRNTAKFGEFDLRNRVVGARVMLLGHNPYTERWHPGDPTTLLDPFIGSTGAISGVTVTPTVLFIHALFADLHYRYQKFIWLFIQLLLFAGIVAIAISRAENPETKAAVLLVGVMCSCSTFWRLHVERGQAYVLFSFFAVLYISSFAWRTVHRGAIGGFFLGLLVCLRPQMVVLGLPLLVYRKWSCIVGSVAGIAVGVLMPLAVSHTAWPDYVHAMTRYVQPPASPKVPRIAPPSSFELPEEVEGIYGLATFAKFGDTDTSLKMTLVELGVPQSPRLFFALLLIGATVWLVTIYRMHKRGIPLDFCTAKSLALVLLIELVLPIKRGEYSNMILAITVLMIFSIRSRMSAIRMWEWGLILLAWLFSAPFPPWMSVGYRSVVAELIGPCAILFWAWFTPWRQTSANVPISSIGEIGPLGAGGKV